MKKGLQKIEDSCSTILTNRRNHNVDFIRVIACIAVVGLHTFPKDLSIVTTSLYYICGFAVPAFFISSGYFLLNRGKVECRYVIHKCIGIIRVVFLWNIIFLVLGFIKQLIIDKEATINLLTFAEEFFKSFVQKGKFGQFWYLGTTLIIYALLPILSRMNFRQKNILLSSCGVISIVIEELSIMNGVPLQKNVIQTFRIWTWLFYFLLGAEMPRIKDWISTRINLIVHFGVCVFVTVFVIVYQVYVGSNIIHEVRGTLHAEYFYDDFIEMVWITLIFTFLLRIDFKSYLLIQILRLAPLTMGIYIIHLIVSKVTFAIIGNDSIVRSIIYWIITTMGAVIITWIIKKIPFEKYLIQI